MGVYCTHLHRLYMFIFYHVYLIICFVRRFVMKTSTWMSNLEFSVADLWPAVMWHEVWRALSASLWRHAGNLENLQQRYGESKVLRRWGLKANIQSNKSYGLVLSVANSVFSRSEAPWALCRALAGRNMQGPNSGPSRNIEWQGWGKMERAKNSWG